MNEQTITAEGQLRHHFWGDYHASIYLHFASDIDAAVALAHALPEWKANPKAPSVIGFHGKGAALESQLAALEALGADMAKVNSVAKSIDVGEPFTITITGCSRALFEAEGQTPLF